jgi:MFS transporter, ACS family, glucarate transporter
MSTLHDPWLDRAADGGGRGHGQETNRPTRVRFTVLASACVLAVITYIHRVGFATAIAEIKGPLGLSDGHLGWLMASFMVAYGLFEMPWGSLGDRLGVRNILAAIILGGSALTAALVLVVLLPQKVIYTFTFLLVVRFLFGAFQAGTFPAISRMMADWMPLQERGGAQGLLWMSSRVGGAAAPSFLVWLIAVIGNWQAPVLLAAGLGAVWCFLFWPWFRNQPEAMRQVNQVELKIIESGRAAKAAGTHGKIPWSAMVRSRSVVALCAMYGFLGYSGNFFLTLLPTYLKNHRHLSSETAGFLTSMPFACGTVACLMGGAMSDVIIRRWGPRWGRRTVGAIGMTLAAVCILCTAWANTVPLLGILLCLTFIGNDLAMGPAWAAAADIGGRHTGVLSGAMNMMASLTAALGALATGYLFESGHMILPFVIFSSSYLLGAISWLGVDVRRTLADPL